MLLTIIQCCQQKEDLQASSNNFFIGFFEAFYLQQFMQKVTPLFNRVVPLWYFIHLPHYNTHERNVAHNIHVVVKDNFYQNTSLSRNKIIDFESKTTTEETLIIRFH